MCPPGRLDPACGRTRPVWGLDPSNPDEGLDSTVPDWGLDADSLNPEEGLDSELMFTVKGSELEQAIRSSVDGGAYDKKKTFALDPQ